MGQSETTVVHGSYRKMLQYHWLELLLTRLLFAVS